MAYRLSAWPAWLLSTTSRASGIFLLVILLLVAGGEQLVAQNHFAVFDLDDSGDPIISARFYPLDGANNVIHGLDKSDVKVLENGLEREILSVSCPPPNQPVDLSSVLMIDISLSMTNGAGMAAARSAALAWVNMLQLGASECAVASFDAQNYLNQDFTTDRSLLTAAVNSLMPQGGTDYDAAFINPPAGAIRIAERGRNKRVVVFLTDGSGGGTEDEILRMANAANVTIYCVTIGMSAPNILKNISERTGGAWFENIRSQEEAETVYRTILAVAQGAQPCTIQWRSRPLCTDMRRVVVSIPARSLQGVVERPVPQDAVPRIGLAPAFTFLGEVPPGTTRDTILTLTAYNRPVTITAVTTDDSRFTIIGGPPPARVLQPGESMNVRVRFTPTDSSYQLGMLVVESDACSKSDAYISGGYMNRGPTPAAIRVLHPNGGEELPVGADTVITWTGISPESRVRLEYSTDEGVVWNMVAPSATGLSHRWTVPATPSRRCLMRVTHVLEEDDVVTLLGHTGPVTEVRFSPDGLWAVTGSGDSTLKIWNARTGELIRSIRLSFTVRAIEFSPDGNQILVSCNDQYRGDYAMLYNRMTGDLVRQLAGTSMSTGIAVAKFSPDGRNIILGQMDGNIELCTNTDVPIFKVQPLPHKKITSINFSPDGRNVAIGYGLADTILILNAGNGTVTRVLNTSTLREECAAVWSPDGSQIAVLFDNVTIYDFPAFTVRHAFQAPANFMAFSPNGRYIVIADQTGGSGGTFSVFEVSSGALKRAYLHRQNGDVLRVQFSADSRRIISGGSEGIGKIWDFDPPVFQPDVSDALWAIVQPVAVAADLDMGDVVVGGTKDSLVTAYICNGGDGTMSVTGISIEGAQADEFSIVSGDAPFVLGAGECRAVEFRFKPLQTGPRSAEVVITTSSGTLRQGIRGRGVQQAMVIDVQIIDFGAIPVGTTKDTTVDIVIRNVGTDAAVVDATELLGPDTQQFTIESGGGSFTLAAGEGRRMTLRFTARRVGRTSGRIVFNFPQAGSPLTVLLFGEGLCAVGEGEASHTLQLGQGDMQVEPGDTVLIPVFVRQMRNFPSGSGKYRMSIRLNRRLLFPLDSFSVTGADAYSTIAGDTLIHYTGSWGGDSDTLLRLGFLAALGDVEETEVGIETFMWGFDCPVNVDLITHAVRVKVCREGESPRLFIDNGESLALKPVRPNPAGDHIAIEFSMIESGRTDLYLVDALGNRAATILHAELPAGEHRMDFDLSQLPSGLYHCVLQTPSRRITTGVVVEH